jgi:hypothetical protein
MRYTRAKNKVEPGRQIMADTKHASYGGYSPDMDGPSHEATYQGFVRFAEIGSVVVLCHVLALAVGGIKHAWLTAIFGVVLSLVAGAIGAFSPQLGWRPAAAVGVLLLVALILY